MNKNNLCYCILTLQYIQRHCVVGYLLVVTIIASNPTIHRPLMYNFCKLGIEYFNLMLLSFTTCFSYINLLFFFLTFLDPFIHTTIGFVFCGHGTMSRLARYRPGTHPGFPYICICTASLYNCLLSFLPVFSSVYLVLPLCSTSFSFNGERTHSGKVFSLGLLGLIG